MKRKVLFSALATALLSIMLSASVFAGTADAAAKAAHSTLDLTTETAARITNSVYAEGTAAVAKETAAAIKTAEQAMADAGKIAPAQILADSEKKLADFGASEAKKQQDAINKLANEGLTSPNAAQIAAIKSATAQRIAEATKQQAALQEAAAMIAPAAANAAAYKAAADAACADFEAKNAAAQVVIKQAYDNKIEAINTTCKQLQDQYIATADALNAYNKAVVDNKVANIVANAQNTVNNYALANAAYQHSTVASITTLLAKRPQAITNADFATALQQQIDRADSADKVVLKTSADLAAARLVAAASAAPILPLGDYADANMAVLNTLKSAYPANVEAVIKANDDAVKIARAQAEEAGAALLPALANAAASDAAAKNLAVLVKYSAPVVAVASAAPFEYDGTAKAYQILLENRVKLLNDALAFTAEHAAKAAKNAQAVEAAKAVAAQSFATAAVQHAVMQLTKETYAASLANTYSNSVAAITAQSIVTAAAYDAAAVENARNATDLSFAAAVSVPNAQALLAQHINKYFYKVYAARV